VLEQQEASQVGISVRSLHLMFLIMFMGAMFFTVISLAMSPSEDKFRRTLASLPLPVKSYNYGYHLLTVIIITTSLFIFAAPIVIAYGVAARVGLIALIAGLLAFIFGISDSVLFALLIIEFLTEVLTWLLGRNKSMVRTVAIPLALVLLSVLGVVGIFELLSAKVVPVWLSFTPTYWSAQAVLNMKVVNFFALAAIASFETIGLIILLSGRNDFTIERFSELIFFRSKLWLKWLSLSISQVEIKLIFRDLEVLVGNISLLALVSAIYYLLFLKEPYYFHRALPIATQIIFLVILIICHTSYGRYLDTKYAWRSLPVSLNSLLLGKLLGALVSGLIFGWLIVLPLLPISGLAKMAAILVNYKLLFVPLLSLLAFLMGILIPYRRDDPLVSLWTASLFMILIGPITYLFGQIRQRFGYLFSGHVAHIVLYLVGIVLVSLSIYYAHKQRESYDMS
jgi:hypothetical protein